MRILLVNPPRSAANGIYDHAPPDVQRLIHRKLIGPPLGLLMLATVCKAEHDVALLEIKGETDLDPNAPAPIAEIPIAPLTEQVSQASGEGGGVAVPGATPELMTRDEFFDFFSHAFTVSGGIVGMVQPPPLDSLMRAGELPTARPCARAWCIPAS